METLTEVLLVTANVGSLFDNVSMKTVTSNLRLVSELRLGLLLRALKEELELSYCVSCCD